MKRRKDRICDQRLIKWMLSSNEIERQKGWEEWYKRDKTSLQTFVESHWWVKKHPEYSEDIVQDSFIKGFQNVSTGRFQDRGKPLQAYLCGIAKNLILEEYRHQMREISYGAYIDLNDKPKEIGYQAYISSLDDKAIGPEDRIVIQECLDVVKAAHKRLPHPYRRIIDGLYVQGKSSKELGNELHKTANNTRVLSHRAIAAIQTELKRHHKLCLSADAIRACLESD